MGNEKGLIMSDEKPLDLNDQLAMAALQMLTISPTNESRKFAVCNYYITGEVDEINEHDILYMDRLAEVAYLMAKSMRKARLSAFK